MYTYTATTHSSLRTWYPNIVEDQLAGAGTPHAQLVQFRARCEPFPRLWGLS